MNHATAHKPYSYESWLRIWNPELFHISTRDPSFFQTNEERRQRTTNRAEGRALGFGHRRLVQAREGAARPWSCPRGQSSSIAGGSRSSSWAAMAEHALELAQRVCMAMKRAEEVRKRLRGRLSIHFKMAGAWDTWWQPSAMVECSVHGGHVQSRCHSLNHFLVHVACSEVAGVGGDFGPFPGRIGHWAKNEVC